MSLDNLSIVLFCRQCGKTATRIAYMNHLIKPDNAVIKTYVWHGSKCFFVSTIERDSSAMLAPGRYNETIVWTYDWEKRERGEIVGQDEDRQDSIQTHLCVCRKLFKTGKMEEDDDN